MHTKDTLFYGPHACSQCGRMIAKAAVKQGGAEYNYPLGPIYPNTDWRRHDCPGSAGLPKPDESHTPTPSPFDFGLSAAVDSAFSEPMTSYDPPAAPDTSSYDFGGGGGFDGGGGGSDF